jgi:hypothetical protein
MWGGSCCYRPENQERTVIEIRGHDVEEPRGGLDEVCGQNCIVHLERMSDHGFCLIVDDPEAKRQVIVNLWTSKRARIGAFVYEDHTKE